MLGLRDAVRRRMGKFLGRLPKDSQVVSTYSDENSSNPPNDAEIKMRQQLEMLYVSTRAAKLFQREIVKHVESCISASSKLQETYRKLANECTKYALQGPNRNFPLSEACGAFGKSISQIEDQRRMLHETLNTQVIEPLRVMIMSEQLEVARNMCHRYERMWQEVQAQAVEVSRRNAKRLKSGGSLEYTDKVEEAESKLNDLKSAMATLGKEAAFAMMHVQHQQQSLTWKQLIAMILRVQKKFKERTEEEEEKVEAENVYHQCISKILKNLEMEMVDQNGASSTTNDDEIIPNTENFIAKVIHPFEAQEPGELSLALHDYVVVRQVSPTGWSEGECQSKCGWFPTSHVRRVERVPSHLMEGGFYR